MKYLVYILMWLIMLIGGLGVLLVVIFTAISWVFEMATDWLYEKTDELYFTYCNLNAKILNKK